MSFDGKSDEKPRANFEKLMILAYLMFLIHYLFEQSFYLFFLYIIENQSYKSLLEWKLDLIIIEQNLTIFSLIK